MARHSSRSKISAINRMTGGRKVQLVLAFLLAQTLFFYSDCFKVQHVHIEGAERVPQSQVLAASGLGHKPGVHVADFSLAAVRSRLLDMLWVEDADVRYRFPNEVDISVKERHPVILVAFDDGRSSVMQGAWRHLDWYTVDGSGVILERIHGSVAGHLPRLLIDRRLRVRKKLGIASVDKVLQWSPILKHVCDDNIAYYRVDAMGQVSFVTRLVHRPTLVRIGAPEKDYKVQVLQMLCERIEREGRPVDYVDLRWEYPAIRYPPEPVALKTGDQPAPPAAVQAMPPASAKGHTPSLVKPGSHKSGSSPSATGH